MRDPKDTEWADQWISDAFEVFFAQLCKKYGGVSYAFAYTLWDQTINRVANKGWDSDLSRAGSSPRQVDLNK